ncbi:MAG: phosphoglycerate dehydrogenase [Firmicutes bacterium]|nr:phosphoglycerate dehydrogenase [Bacillota bacterium]
MSIRVLVTPRTFGKSDPVPMEMLREAGCDIVSNPYGRLMSEEEIIQLIQDVDGVIAGLDPFNARVLSKAHRLKVVSRYGVGVNNVDLDYANSKGIAVTNTPGANSLAVAELTLGLLFAVCRRINLSERGIRQGMWRQYPGQQLEGKTLGIVGTGQIGKQVAELARGLRMRVVCHDICPDEAWAQKTGAVYMPFDELICTSDFISLHIPLSEHTYHLISHNELRQMKPSAVIINTSRGGIIDEDALCEAIRENRIWGAGLDVFEEEPPVGSLLLELDGVVLTSHIGAHTQESVQNMGRMAVANLLECLSGQIPKFVVNADVTGSIESASAG